MSFDEVRLPTLITWGFSGGAEYNTDIIVLSSGYEKRNVNWEESRYRYTIAYTIKQQDELDELVAFFRARKGKARGFRFRDLGDYKLENEQIAVADGIATAFQITKTYAGSSDVRELKKIATQADSDSIALDHASTALTFAVKVNSILQTESVDYTIDRNTGIITFTSPPTATHPITVTCEFDVPVRFDTDSMVTNIQSLNNYSWEGVQLVEIRL